MDKDLWKVEIQLRNSQHQVLDTVEVEREFAYTDLVSKQLDPLFKPKLVAMGWTGFGLWAEHIPIKPETTFAHINFMRKANKRIVLQCEDHACQWRAITTPVTHADECVVCLDAKPPADKMPMCGHAVLCDACRGAVVECPICRYPFGK